MPQTGDLAVLTSGGLDSAILAIEALRGASRVFPIYVRFGLRWEDVELNALQGFLNETRRSGLMPLTVLNEPVAEVYGLHWSTKGGPSVPDDQAPDQAVELPGRNLLLVGKAAVWCKLRGIPTLALGLLASNPFPDSSDRFFEHLTSTIHLALPGPFEVVRPFSQLSKTDVLRLGRDLPLERTFSCLKPGPKGRHCGRCNKCGERIRGFLEAGLPDRTEYQHRSGFPNTSPKAIEHQLEPDRIDFPCIGSPARSRSATATGS